MDERTSTSTSAIEPEILPHDPVESFADDDLTDPVPSDRPRPSLPARAMLAFVRLYQRVTANRPSPCRYVPTCSSYSLDAFEQHGFVRGLWLTTRRISRCHPWGGHGWDPVPPRRHRHADTPKGLQS